MPLHLIKLAVGCDNVQDLVDWIEETRLSHKRMGRPYEQLHTTRMFPKRVGETPEEGASLYWVIKSRIQARQRLLCVRPFTDPEGIKRCHLVIEPVVHLVRPRPMSPFQGWRYLDDKDAPPDMADLGADAEMPEAMRKELAVLGLL
jgi:hypothetical protein